jgi:hypothetical protein
VHSNILVTARYTDSELQFIGNHYTITPMKSIYPKIALIFLFAVSTYAQDNCLTNTSEILLNLQLGMTVEEVNRRFSNLKIRIKTDDDYRFFQNYIDKKPPNNLTGVRALYLRFFEKKLYQIEIFYEENKYPADIKSFAEIVSTNLNLSADWKFAHRQAVYQCGESWLKIDYQLNPRIELTDETIRQKVADLRKKENN